MNKTYAQPQTNLHAQVVPAYYQENLTRVYQFVFVHVNNRAVAEDLTSQVFLKAVRHLDDRHDSHSIQSWLLRVAHTTVMDYWRAVKRAPTASLDDLLDAGWEIPDEDGIPGTNNGVERVQQILQQLPERYREVLRYRFLLGYTVSETALSMGVTEANVKTLQFRALKKAATLEIAMT